MAGTSMPVVSRSTVMAMLGRRSFLYRRMSWSTRSAAPVILRTAASLYCSSYLALKASSSRRLTMSACASVAQKIERLLLAERVQLVGELLADDAVEVLVDDALVEALDLEIEFVFELGRLDLAGGQVQRLDLLALGEVDALAAQQRLVADGRLVVDQPVVGDSLAVRVGEDGLAEDLGGVACRRGREADAHGVEVVEHAAVAGEVLGMVAHGQLAFGHVLVERVAAVGLVDDDAVVGVHRRRRVAAEHALEHGLHGGHLHAGLGLGGHVTQLGDVVDLGERLVLLQRGLVEGVLRLRAQRVAVDQEQDAAEALGLQQPVHQADDRARLAGAGGHRQQAGAAALGQSGLDGGDGLVLVVAQPQVGVAVLLQLAFGLLPAAGEQVQQALRRVEAGQRPCGMRRRSQVTEPGPARFGQLLDEGAAVA